MTIYALVDCNNFYASCERIFKPVLVNKPIVVLSNNDGCIIARSEEAKKLGIPMGAAFHQYQFLLKKHKIQVFSSNYALYGDISNRVMNSLRLLCSDVEVYSIDEAFLQLDGFSAWNLYNYTLDIREKIMSWTGMPISIGIGATKTVAKIANKIAKQENIGICDLRDSNKLDQVLTTFKVENIWGIGRHLAPKLNRLGIHTAQQLRDYSAKIIRKHFGVVVEKIILELHGTSCLGIEQIKPKQNIMSSRSFGKNVTDFNSLAEAISTYTIRASEKLRGQNGKAQGIYVFIATSCFREASSQYQNGQLQSLTIPTDDTIQLITIAKQALKKIYLPGYHYYKAGVMLTDIVPTNSQQLDLLFDENTKRMNLMKTIDAINQKLGKKTLFVAAQGTNKSAEWHMRSNNKSPCYTTSWAELLEVAV